MLGGKAAREEKRGGWGAWGGWVQTVLQDDASSCRVARCVCVCVCRLWVGACRASQCVCGRSQMRPQQSFQAVALCMWSYAVLV